jgi:hypothetical protein
MTFGILAWSLVAAGLLALLLGGDLRNLGLLRIRVWWLLPTALLLKITAITLDLPPAPWAQPAVFGLVAIGLVANWRLPGAALVGCGLLLNVLVTVSNGGVMPFSASALEAAGRPVARSEAAGAFGHPDSQDTRLAWLDDRIPFPPTHQAFSVGDIFVMAGGAWLVIGASRPARLTRLGRLRAA